MTTANILTLLSEISRSQGEVQNLANLLRQQGNSGAAAAQALASRLRHEVDALAAAIATVPHLEQEVCGIACPEVLRGAGWPAARLDQFGLQDSHTHCCEWCAEDGQSSVLLGLGTSEQGAVEDALIESRNAGIDLDGGHLVVCEVVR